MPFPQRRRPHRAVASAVLLLATSLTACTTTGEGGASTATPHSPAHSTATGGAIRITIKDFTYVPAVLTVRPGAKITVDNKDSAPHSVTATGGKGGFDTGTIKGGATATFTAPTKPGSYPYYCDIHEYMKGKLTVRG
ncbi:cupredoxin domain-containing protein [Streptomyces gilvosporeus]|uniref:EfeO-type cupredoxin-like domain-containing protein n=1 Tax=Streptomyces gilvosporeus TaxID=553510 RepID=A0A1V0TZ95_9ACTN|nr:cupredoxin domain-containing protein [Streptomyces gilvosporeus]ARF58128.1 hypothetical protein B1H19_31630 [Streptomyces gilvosporeus]